jgi:hypothetical protein
MKILGMMALTVAGAIGAAQPASAAEVIEVEANDTIGTAQNIDNFFSLNADPDIEQATTIPHATVRGLPGNGTYDYYRFMVATAGSRGIFDIDYALNFDGLDFDAYLNVFDAGGTSLRANDDASTTNGAGGSVHGFDSYLTYTFNNAGTYFARVGNCCVSPQSSGNGYELQVSIQNHALTAGAVPEPATWAMMIGGFGLAGATLRRRRRDGARLATA